MRDKNMSGIIALIVAAVALTAFFAKMRPNGPSSDSPPDSPPQAAASQKTPAAKSMTFDQAKAGAIHTRLEFEGRGGMDIDLYPKAAPETVKHIVSLISKGFYDGIKVHRLEPGFVIQVGDPKTRGVPPDQFAAVHAGEHGSGTTVPLEAALPHLPNTVALARTQDPNTGDSQFYINLAANSSLDGQYCVFGKIVGGAGAVSKIQLGDTIKSFRLK